MKKFTSKDLHPMVAKFHNYPTSKTQLFLNNFINNHSTEILHEIYKRMYIYIVIHTYYIYIHMDPTYTHTLIKITSTALAH